MFHKNREQLIGKQLKVSYEEKEQYFYSLHSIINQMTVSRKSNELVYKKFFALLISDRKESVIEYIMNAIISCFIKDKPEEELIFSNPNSLASFFVNITREYSWIFVLELKHNESKNRYRMVLILKSLFSLKKDLPNINIARELLTESSITIWNAFLQRFTDIEPEIRKVCVQTAEVLLETQIDEQIVSKCQMSLTKRFRDIDELIRCDSADAVDNSSEIKAQNILDENLMKHFIGRIGDNEFCVRRQVLICCSNVFHTIIRKFHKTEQYFFYKLPSGCLFRYCSTDLSEEKAVIEMIFCRNLIDLNEDNSIKMNNLLKLICFCDNKAIKAITELFRNQKKLRSLLSNFISLIEKNGFKKPNIRTEIHVIEEKLCDIFSYIENIDKVFKNFHHMLKSFSDKISYLKDIFQDKFISSQQSMDTIEEFFEKNKNFFKEEEDEELLELFKDELISRCGIGLIDSNAFITLFKQMKTIDQKFAQRLASLIILLSIVYTEYFNDKSVIIELLHLPPVIIAFIASDSMLPFMKCSQDIKEKIKECVAQNSNESISQINL